MTIIEQHIDDFVARAKTAIGLLSLEAVRRLSRLGIEGDERRIQYLLLHTVNTLTDPYSPLSNREKLDLIAIITSQTDLSSYTPAEAYSVSSCCSLKVSGQSFGILTQNQRISDLEARVSWLEKNGSGSGGGSMYIIYGGTPNPADFHPNARF